MLIVRIHGYNPQFIWVEKLILKSCTTINPGKLIIFTLFCIIHTQKEKIKVTLIAFEKKKISWELGGCYGSLTCTTEYNPQKIIWVERSIFQTGINLRLTLRTTSCYIKEYLDCCENGEQTLSTLLHSKLNSSNKQT